MHFTKNLHQLKKLWDGARCLRTAAQVGSAVDQLAAQITQDFKDSNPLVICIMNGGLIFCAQLLVRLPFAVQLDYLQISRYGNKTQGGDLKWLAKPSQCVKDRHVLVVDDILDEGDTLWFATQWLQQQGAASLRSAVLVDKQHTRKCQPGYAADYTGFLLEDVFLFGCGMDYQGYFRNLDGIYAVANDRVAGEA